MNTYIKIGNPLNAFEEYYKENKKYKDSFDYRTLNFINRNTISYILKYLKNEKRYDTKIMSGGMFSAFKTNNAIEISPLIITVKKDIENIDEVQKSIREYEMKIKKVDNELKELIAIFPSISTLDDNKKTRSSKEINLEDIFITNDEKFKVIKKYRDDFINIIRKYQTTIKLHFIALVANVINLNDKLKIKIGIGMKFDENYFKDLKALYEILTSIVSPRRLTEKQEDLLEYLYIKYTDKTSSYVSKIQTPQNDFSLESSISKLGGKRKHKRKPSQKYTNNIKKNSKKTTKNNIKQQRV